MRIWDVKSVPHGYEVRFLFLSGISIVSSSYLTVYRSSSTWATTFCILEAFNSNFFAQKHHICAQPTSHIYHEQNSFRRQT